MERQSLLPYKNRVNDFIPRSFNKALVFGNEFNKFFENKRPSVNNALNKTKVNFSWLNNYKLNFYYSVSYNIFSILIHEKSFMNVFKNRKCELMNCNTCNFVIHQRIYFLKMVLFYQLKKIILVSPQM